MGVTTLLVRWAVRRPHVLLVEVPGQWALRALVEQELAARGWQVAASPAAADVLAVCGHPGPPLSAVVDHIWEQLPGPRVRTEIANADVIGAALDNAVTTLMDTQHHREDVRERRQSPGTDGVADPGHHAMDHGGMDHEQTHHHEMDHEHAHHHEMSHEHADHPEMSHQHMHHDGMDMAPAGIALAQGAEDRDGLEMDVLRVRLGPVLPHWPAGLVLDCRLHGDVITEAQASCVDAEHLRSSTGSVSSLARQCDHIVDVLALAGWPHAAQLARRARDAVLTAGADGDRVRAFLDALHAKVRRSRVLRWSLRDLGALSVDELHSQGWPGGWAGDTYVRLLHTIDHARNGIQQPASSAELTDVVPGIVAGLDVAAARLVIASLGIDITRRTQAGHHG